MILKNKKIYGLLPGSPEIAEIQISHVILMEPDNPDHFIERSNARVSIGTLKSIAGAIEGTFFVF